MIPFTFSYYKPDSIEEAVTLYQQLTAQNKAPCYYSGGTEIITLGRINKLYTDAVIDLKGIPEYTSLVEKDEEIILGAGLSLTELAEANVFPLLTESGGRVADHSSRGKITLGGNICGHFIYREAVLALLVSDSKAVIAGPLGVRKAPMMQAFQGTLQLGDGEFLLQTITAKRYLHLPHRGVKKTRMDRIGYPLISIAILQVDQKLHIAVSGLCDFPFRSPELENVLNGGADGETKIADAMEVIPAPVLDNLEGSADYRKFVFQNTLHDTLGYFAKEVQ